MTYPVANYTRNIYGLYTILSRPHRLRDTCKKQILGHLRGHSALSTGDGGGILSVLTPRQDFLTIGPSLPPKCRVRCFQCLLRLDYKRKFSKLFLFQPLIFCFVFIQHSFVTFAWLQIPQTHYESLSNIKSINNSIEWALGQVKTV